MTKLSANPSAVIIDNAANELFGNTTIYHDVAPGSPIVLWEHSVGGRWTTVDEQRSEPVVTSPIPAWKFPVQLRPGQIYEVVAFPINLDPNTIARPYAYSREFSPPPYAFAAAIRKGPPASDLGTPLDYTVGGTWFRHITTSRVNTHAVLMASRTMPRFMEDAIPEFFNASYSGFHTGTQHDLEVLPLDSGRTYFYQTLLVDEAGRWQVLPGTAATKPRKIKIEFHQIHIINDGRPNDATAEFNVWVMIGNDSVKNYFFGDIDNFDISDRPSEGEGIHEDIPLSLFCPDYTYGPAPTDLVTLRIGILTRGLVKVGIGTNYASSNFQGTGLNDQNVPNPFWRNWEYLPPFGADEEVFRHEYITTAENDWPGLEFRYDLQAFITVTYQ